MAFVFEVMRDLHRSKEGMNPCSGRVCSGTGLIPNNVKSILRISQQEKVLGEATSPLMIKVPAQGLKNYFPFRRCHQTHLPRHGQHNLVPRIRQTHNSRHKRHITTRRQCNVFHPHICIHSIYVLHLFCQRLPHCRLAICRAVPKARRGGRRFLQRVLKRLGRKDSGDSLRHVEQWAHPIGGRAVSGGPLMCGGYSESRRWRSGHWSENCVP